MLAKDSPLDHFVYFRSLIVGDTPISSHSTSRSFSTHDIKSVLYLTQAYMFYLFTDTKFDLALLWRYYLPNRSARLDLGREWAGSLIKPGAHILSKPIKPAATITQHIDLLRFRGMEVDTALANQWLSFVSYYRLSAYWYPARKLTPNGTRDDAFRSGTQFIDAVALYEADRKLRALVHDGMERIEIAMRTRIGEALVSADPLAYADPERFRPEFDHEGWIKTANKRISRAGHHNEAIKHHQNHYASQYPFWVLAEVLDFADISRLYEGLPANDQHIIAKDMGIVANLDFLSKNQRRKTKRQSPLVRWMEQLTIVRNFCAHHARLWNKSFVPAPTAALRTQPQFAALPKGQNEKIFGVLTVMANLIRVTSPGTTWPEKITDLILSDFFNQSSCYRHQHRDTRKLG